MKILTILILSGFLINAQAKPFKKPNGIYEHIKKNSPFIGSVYARRLAREINRASKLHKLDPKLLSAIIAQESSYRMGLVAGSDYGLTMINIRNIKHFIFDKKKLLGNMRYSVNAGAIVLSEIKKRRFKIEGKRYFLRFNCGSKSLKRKICLDYEKRVMRWY